MLWEATSVDRERFLEMVPFRMVSPAKGYEEEAARLLAVGPEPLVPKM